MTAFQLADRCPRLALARDQRLQQLRDESHMRLVRLQQRYRLERLVAHRELQLIRAEAKGAGKYIAVRQRKLVEARAELADFEAPA